MQHSVTIDNLFILKRCTLYHIAVCILAIGYGYTLSNITTLAGFSFENVVDRGNYLVYAESSWGIFQRYLSMGINVLFFNEPAWLLINAFLSLFLNPAQVIQTIIFFRHQ